MWAGLVRSAIQLCRERRFPRHGNPGVRHRHRRIRPHAGTDTAAEDRDSHHAVEAWGVSVAPSVNPGAPTHTGKAAPIHSSRGLGLGVTNERRKSLVWSITDQDVHMIREHRLGLDMDGLAPCSAPNSRCDNWNILTTEERLFAHATWHTWRRQPPVYRPAAPAGATS